MDRYTAFASVYDVMQYDVDYERWHQLILSKIDTYAYGARHLMELACGTGTLGILLSKSGLIVEGLDLSEEMLTLAQKKAYEAGVKMRFYHQDMVTFNTRKKYDVICCMCDGLNYVIDLEELEAVFDNVQKHLNPNGLFIFDFSSHYKLSEVIGNHTFAETFDDEAYIWENAYDEEESILEFTLTLFKKEGSSYVRYEEEHVQRAYQIDEIESLISERFDVLEIVDGDDFSKLSKTSQRVGFIVKIKE